MSAKPQTSERDDGGRGVSGWAVGFTYFASLMLILIGAFHIIAGLTGLVEDEFYVLDRDYALKFDATTWGGIHFVGGIIVLFAGFSLLSGAVWARTVAVIAALLSMFANFAFIPWYPVWSIVMIAISVSVIWALTAHGRDIVVAKQQRAANAASSAGTSPMAAGAAARMTPAGQGGSDPEPITTNDVEEV